MDSRRVFDNPEQCAILNFSSDVVILALGFEYQSAGPVSLAALSFMIWYRFTEKGMLLGYIMNTSGTSVTLPAFPAMYYYVKPFNFNAYQFKFYIQCMGFDLYNNNNFPYEYDYTKSSDEDTVARIAKLDQLSAIQVKAFKELSVSSYLLLPYTVFNSYKFDFEHTMYNTDGTLKGNTSYRSTMFADGGNLQGRYYPQPTVVEPL